MKSILAIALMLVFSQADSQTKTPGIEEVKIINKVKSSTLADRYTVQLTVNISNPNKIKQINITRVNDSRHGADILVGTILPIGDSISTYPIKVDVIVPNDSSGFALQAQFIPEDTAAMKVYTKPAYVRITKN